MFTICCQTPLPVLSSELYKSIAFDGCRYYLTVQCQCRVAVLDCNFCLVKTIKTRRPYTSICFDFKHNCFWAAADQCWDTLFKLDLCLQEIDLVTIHLKGCCIGPFTSLSYCFGNGTLVASFGNKLLEIETGDSTARLLWEDRGDALILSSVCFLPDIALCIVRECKLYFALLAGGNMVTETELPTGCLIQAMLVDPCGCTAKSCGLLLLTNKHGCYPYLLRAVLEGEACRGIYPCSQGNCCTCKKTCCPCPESSCTDILESIALQEAAIAHILNAEGEKLQKAVEVSSSPGELLKINESIQKTILYATHLEQVLFSKLDTLQDICCIEEFSFCPPQCEDK